MIWIAQKHQQWDLLRRKVELWRPASVVGTWVGSPAFRYTWPDGSTLSIITAETDWVTVQGIEPDLVLSDEDFPVALAREMLKRRRGNTRTRFVFNGTATQGITWVYHDLYIPWKHYHEARGITDEREMMRRQRHDFGDSQPDLAGLPGIWCWPMGSHAENPTATRETWAFYKATTTGSKPEQQVRLHGGFREFAGTPVFNLDVLELMRKHLAGAAGVPQGRTGHFEKVEA
jgi:hypothetical protein